MPDHPDQPAGADPVDKIRHLVRLMHKYDLTDVDVVDGSSRIRLRRRGPESAPRPVSYAPAPVAAPSPAQVAPPAPAPQAPPAPAPTGTVIGSPMVGTYYASSSPDAPPFVSVGSVVRPDTTVCVIEAMKVFTDIPADVSGVITEVLVKSGQAVEFDQPLFRVNPA